MHQVVVLADIRALANQAARHRPLVDAQTQDHPHVYANAQQQNARNHEDMQREEARQRRPRDDRAAVHKMHQVGAHKRHAAHDRGADAQAPVGVLVEAQHLAGEGHAEGQQQQHHTDDPGQLARELVRAEHEDLHHVDQHHRDHEVRSPAVQRTQEPAQGHVVVQELKAVPRLTRRRRIHQRQQDAGHHLHHQQHRGGTAEDVPPARGLGGYRVHHRFRGRFSQSKPAFEPVICSNYRVF